MTGNPYESALVEDPSKRPAWTLRRVLILAVGCCLLAPIAAYVGSMVGALVLIAARTLGIVSDDAPYDAVILTSGLAFGIAGAMAALYLSRKYNPSPGDNQRPQ